MKLRLPAAALVAALCLTPCFAQEEPKPTKEDEDIKSAGPVDPFTGNDPALMAEAGIASYGPFAWADGRSSADVETELGKGRFLWLETAHFRICCNLGTAAWPVGQAKRDFVRDEIQEVRKRVKKFPAKPKLLTPWIRLHLYAYRLEKLYADVQGMLGVTDAAFTGTTPPNGPYLGMQDKFLVLLVQKKSDLARYFERFCDQKVATSMRWYHARTNQFIAGVATEVLEGFDCVAVHGHVLYMVTHNLLAGYKGFHLNLPLWFGEGLAHWYSRQVPSDVVNVQILDSEAVSQDDTRADWPVKVRRRAQHEGVCIPFATLAQFTKFEQMGYHAHSQAWSRVDYLMRRDRERVGFMVTKIKELPPHNGGEVPAAQVATLAQKLLIELFELDDVEFDAKWRSWVLKTYPKK